MNSLKCIVISSLVLCGGIALTSAKTDCAVHAAEGNVINVTPRDVIFLDGLVLPGYKNDANNVWLDYYGEYFTASYNGKKYVDFFDLEFKFFPVDDLTDENKFSIVDASKATYSINCDYPSLVLSQSERVYSTSISRAIDLFYDQDMLETNFSVALRYLAKDGSGYIDSNKYYVPYQDSGFSVEQKANTCHKFTPASLDLPYDPYLFGPSTEAAFDWRYTEETKLIKNGLIYSLELDLKIGGNPNDDFKMYALPTGSGIEAFDDRTIRKEFPDIPVPENAKYRFEFSYRPIDGFTPYTSNDNTISGYYRLTKINDIVEEPEVVTGINVLPGNAKLLNINQLGNVSADIHTNGKEDDGNNITARGEVMYFLYELTEAKDIESFKLFWEASCPLNYEIYTSSKATDNSLVAELTKDVASSEYGNTCSTIDMNNYSDFVKVADVKRVSNEQGQGGTDIVKATRTTEAKYVLIRTTVGSNNAISYGYRLFEIEAFEPSFNQSFVGAQLGTKVDNGQVVNAIRFIGSAKIDDITTYTDTVSFKLTYSNGTETKTSKPIEINTYYKTLITTMDGVSGVSMTAPEGNYFFSFTLGGIMDGTYTIDLNVTDSENNTLTISSATYKFEGGKLTRA